MVTFCKCETCQDIKKKMENKTTSDHNKNLVEISSEYCIDVDNGKYSVYQKKNGALRASGHGGWRRILTGDNLVFNLMVELIEAKEKIQKVSDALKPQEFSIPIEIISKIIKGEIN